MPNVPTEEQKAKSVEYFVACNRLTEKVYARVKNRKASSFSKKELDWIIDELLKLIMLSEEMAKYLNSLDCSLPPYNLYQGDINHINHASHCSDFMYVRLNFDGLRANHDTSGKWIDITHHLDQAEQSYVQLKTLLSDKDLNMKTLERFHETFKKSLDSSKSSYDRFNTARKEFMKEGEHLWNQESDLESPIFSVYRDFSITCTKYYEVGKHEQMVNSLYYNLKLFKLFHSMIQEDIPLERFYINEVVSNVVRTRPLMGHHDRAQIVYKPVRVKVEFNKDALYWILMRFLSNAEWYTYLVENPKIIVEIKIGKHQVKLVVKDNGLGPENAEKIKRIKGPIAGSRRGRSYPAIKQVLKLAEGTVEKKRTPLETVVALKLKRATSRK